MCKRRGIMSLYTNHQKKICVMCGHKEKDGIMVQQGFICDDCANEIVHTEVEDEKYAFFIEKMKALWTKNASTF